MYWGRETKYHGKEGENRRTTQYMPVLFESHSFSEWLEAIKIYYRDPDGSCVSVPARI